jgi:hypothetical protein
MYIPGPSINYQNSPRFVGRKLFAEQSRIKRKPPRVVEDDTVGLLCWGVVGELPSAEPMPTTDVNVELTEISRETTDIRIENPDDPNQYVDAKQTDKMKMEKKEPQEKNNSATKDAELDEGYWERADQINAFSPTAEGGGPPTNVIETWVFHPPERTL